MVNLLIKLVKSAEDITDLKQNTDTLSIIIILKCYLSIIYGVAEHWVNNPSSEYMVLNLYDTNLIGISQVRMLTRVTKKRISERTLSP